MKKNILFLALIVSISCSKTNYKHIQVENVISDTLFMPIDYRARENCCFISEGFLLKFGINISTFYYIEETIFVDNDSIAMLKPFYTNQNFSDCYPSKADDNLIITYNKITKRTNVFKNLLFNNDRNVYQEISLNDNGFIVYSEQGNSSKLFTKIYISKNKIDSIHIESWGFNQYSEIYRFNDFNVQKFTTKFIDSLQQNLNNKKNKTN